MAFKIGVVGFSNNDYYTKPIIGAIDEVKQVLFEITDEVVVEEPLFGLAGPNEVFEIIGSAKDWGLLVKAIFLLYGAEFVKEAGKEGWKNRIKNYQAVKTVMTTPLLQLFKSLDMAREKKYKTFLAVPTGGRNAGIDVTNCSYEEIAMIIVLMEKYADLIQLSVERCRANNQIEKLAMFVDQSGHYQIIEIRIDSNGALSVESKS